MTSEDEIGAEVDYMFHWGFMNMFRSWSYDSCNSKKKGSMKASSRTYGDLSRRRAYRWVCEDEDEDKEEEEDEDEDEKQVEELVYEYGVLCLLAVPKDFLKFIILLIGFLSFVSTSFPIQIATRDGEKPNWPPVEVVRVILTFLAVAFHGSVTSLLMVGKLPKLSFYCGYVSLISLLFALGMIAFFTVMWVFERI